ncbi:hypothetical protein AAHE18_04G240100 [Arachis hypogaea]|nr:pathogenesis-related protein 1-like isoform X1 [Arachis hypogaea]XP_025692294.1 pathogenesis-related protein 1-like isoform X1 [Arachis hypogaea]QHO09789.1 Pathogenesis-related protein [Arachis hypogaea]
MKIWIVVIKFISVVPLLLMAQNYPEDYLKVHNDARASVGVHPLEWNNKMEDLARAFVNDRAESCKLNPTGWSKVYGRISIQNSRPITGADAVARWLKTKNKYNYKSNSCTDKKNYTCVPYVQIVWGGTIALGCARVRCYDIKKGLLLAKIKCVTYISMPN